MNSFLHCLDASYLLHTIKLEYNQTGSKKAIPVTIPDILWCFPSTWLFSYLYHDNWTTKLVAFYKFDPAFSIWCVDLYLPFKIIIVYNLFENTEYWNATHIDTLVARINRGDVYWSLHHPWMDLWNHPYVSIRLCIRRYLGNSSFNCSEIWKVVRTCK